MDTLDNYNHTPLSLAIKEERYLAAKYLIQNNADINKGGY